MNLRLLLARLSPPSGGDDDELIALRKQIVQLVSILSALIGTLAYFSTIFAMVQNHSWIVAGIQTIAFALVILLMVIKELGYKFRAGAILVLLFMLGSYTLFQNGLAGEGRLFLVIFVVMAFVLLDLRMGALAYLLGVLSVLAMGWVMVQGMIPQPAQTAIDDSSKLLGWITGSLVYILLTGLVVGSLYALIAGLQKTLQGQHHSSQELIGERDRLGQRLQESTRDLQQRTFQLETAARYSQEVCRLNDLDAIINRTVSTFTGRLAHPDLAIFLLHPEDPYYLYQAGAGKAVETLQAVRLPVGQTGLVQIIEQGEPVVLRNTMEEGKFFHQLGLPDRKGLLLLPLRETKRSIGVILLVLGDEQVVSTEDLLVYQSVSDQLGSSLQKVRLQNLLQKNVEELKISGRQDTQRAWRSYLRAGRQKIGYHYDLKRIVTEAAQGIEAAQALKERKLLVTSIAASGNGEAATTSVAAPIILRDQPLGVIDIRFKSEAVPADLVNLIEATTKRLALALENARLMDEVKQRAEREHLVSDISSRVRASSDIDGILKVAALEIGRSLGVAEVLVQLRSEQ